MADVAFATSLLKIDGAVSGASVEPEMREKIAAEGLWEADQSYVLAGNAKGPYFDRIDVSGTYPRALEISAEAGPAFVAPPDEVWKTSTSIAIKSPTESDSDVSRAFVQAWPFPGVPAGQGVDPTAFAQIARSAGWGGLVAGLPSVALALLGLPYHRPPVFASIAPILRFERLGTFRPVVKQAVLPQVFFGLLAEGTSRAAAECALAEAVPCRDRLKLGAITEIKGSFVRLAAVEKRFVVLVGTSRASVDVDLGLHSVGPAWLDVPLPAEMIPGEGAHLIGSVQRRGTSVVWRFARP
jgi:hypothetical protein